MKKILVYLISTVMFFCSFINAEYTFAQDLISKHTYIITKGNIQFATTVNTLYKSNGKSVFQVLSSTSGIFKLKKDIRKETSLFKILNDKVISEEYTFSRQKKDSYESYLTKISRDKTKKSSTRVTKNNQDETIYHPYLKNVQDRLSVQLDYKSKLKAGQYNQVYTVLDKGRVREYRYNKQSIDTVPTIFGDTKCIVVKRTIKNNKRSTITWYAIEHDFIPVIINQYRKNNLQFTVQLDSVGD
tara:strand:- start:1815 stop:2543 length:729 start_codon:yes stop_codon:yes gene_type:complete